MKTQFLWILMLALIMMTAVRGQGTDNGAGGDGTGGDGTGGDGTGGDGAGGDGAGGDGATEEKDEPLKFIGDGAAAKPESGKSFRPKVMIHNDSKDVLRKVVKEKDTAYIIQFYKQRPDRDLREQIFQYVLMPKENEEKYQYAPKYEYSEIDVENPLYKDLVDNLSFKKKFGEDADYPYILYTF